MHERMAGLGWAFCVWLGSLGFITVAVRVGSKTQVQIPSVPFISRGTPQAFLCLHFLACYVGTIMLRRILGGLQV